MSRTKRLLLVSASALAMTIATGKADATTFNFGYTGSSVTFTAPTSGFYEIDVFGASGGTGAASPGVGGLGAEVKGEIFLTNQELLTIVVGGLGQNANNTGTFFRSISGGGGGGSFVTDGATLLAAAGGGGGAGFVGSGGDGLAGTDGGAGVSPQGGGQGGTGGNGGTAGNAFLGTGGGGAGFVGAGTEGGDNPGGHGGEPYSSFAGGVGNYGGNGGFGGGGGAGVYGGGGGGGYSGGGGGGASGGGGGGGGGSFLAGEFTDPVLTAGIRFGNGDVSISSVPEPSTWAMMLAGFTGLGAIALRRKRKITPA
jgi:hypothetical protein